MQQRREKGYAHFIAGGISGTGSAVLCQPFDVLKTKMIGTRNVKSFTIMQTLRYILKKDGVFGLYRGSVATFWRVLPGSAIHFGMLNQTTRLAQRVSRSEKLSPSYNFCVGAVSRSVAAICVNPITVVKTRLEYTIGSRRPGFFSTLREIAVKEGRRGLFAGLVPTVARDGPYSGLFFVIYNITKDFLQKLYKADNTSEIYITWPSGGIAGALATLLTHPFDVVRTRLQLQAAGRGIGQHRYAGVIDAFISIPKEEGVKRLFSGVIPRLLKRTFSSSIVWAAYETILKSFRL